jgi:Protein of unknown function (DUF3311)
MTQAATRSRSAVAAHPVICAAIPLYARVTPAWGDFPFFYWYLLIIMPVTSLALWLAAQLQKRVTVTGTGAPGAPSAAAGDEATR